jgi:ATP-dependent Lon protease
MSSTGAITLSGTMCKVDSIATKVSGAKEAGQRAVLLPASCQPNVLAMPADDRAGMEFHYVTNVAEALRSAVVGA